MAISLSIRIQVQIHIYMASHTFTYTFYTYIRTHGWLSKCWFLSSALLPHLHWGPHCKYLVGLPYLHFSKIQGKVYVVWQAQYHGPFFQSSVLSVVSLLLTSSRLSRLCLGDLKCSLLGWPASWVAGWLASG